MHPVLFCASISCGFSTFAMGQARFFGLGDIPGGSFNSHASMVSADGTTAIGGSKAFGGFTGEQAFRWTAETGMVSLGNLPSSYPESDARGVSYTGEFVVGGSSSFNGREAFLWSQSTGMIGLGDLPGQDFAGNATGVSRNGRIVVGWSDSAENFDGGHQAFRWTPDTGMVGLGFLPGGRVNSSFAKDISASGEVIVGKSVSSTGTQGFRWTEQTGMIPLASLPGSIENFNAAGVTDVSSNGRYITGFDLNGDLLSEAVLWTPDGEAIGLGFLEGFGALWTHGASVSNNGRVVVGSGEYGLTENYAWVWTPDNGLITIDEALLIEGIDIDAIGWTLDGASGVSADGHWVTGFGANPDGNAEAWLAYLPSIPTPSTLAPLAVFGLLATRRRRQA